MDESDSEFESDFAQYVKIKKEDSAQYVKIKTPQHVKNEKSPFSWPERNRHNLDAIDSFLLSESSLKDDVAVVMKHHLSKFIINTPFNVRSGLYLVRPRDFSNAKDDLWESNYNTTKSSFDFSKTRAILPIKVPEKQKDGIFAWTYSAQKRIIETFLLCCARRTCVVSKFSPRMRALIAKFMMSVSNSHVTSSSSSSLFRLGIFNMIASNETLRYIGKYSDCSLFGKYNYSLSDDASLDRYSDLIDFCTAILHRQRDRKSAVESVLRFVCLVIFATGNRLGINMETEEKKIKRSTACKKERPIIRLVSHREDLNRVIRSLCGPDQRPICQIDEVITESDLSGLPNSDFDLTLASIVNSDLTRFLNHNYQPCIFLEKDHIVICGVLYCLWGGNSERHRNYFLESVGGRETDLIAMELRLPRIATSSRKHIQARITNLLNKREIYCGPPLT